jgi:hypothetical protein
VIASLLGFVIAGRSLGGWLKMLGAALMAIVPIAAYFVGRRAGGSAERERQQKAISDALRRIQDADANGPRTSGDAVDRLRKHDF